MSKVLNHIDCATDAAISLAHNAALALQEQRSGKGLSPASYRRRIQAIKALTWCALNDLGQAKRAAIGHSKRTGDVA